MQPETKYARSGDVCIAYQVTGDGPVNMVLAPGTMSHLDLDWEIPSRTAYFSAMSRHFRLVRFDKRGTGLSDRPTHMATLEERTDDIRAVMDAAGLQKAHIFGVSEGGSMASLFAATYPQRTESLLIWGAQARWVATEGHPWGQTQTEHDEMLEMIRHEWPSVEYITGPGAGLGKDVDPARLAAIVRYMRSAGSPAAVLAYETMNGEIDTRSILPLIQARTLVMNRTGDPVAHVEAARDMAARIPGAIFKEYPGDNHSMMLDDMETIISDIREFVTGERPSEVSDRILATVLFLDIVGSTDKAVELGDSAWKHLLNSYYAIVRKELARYRGVETNNAGDGFLATFDGPGRAVSCGLAIARNVRELGIEVRVGVHTGECERMGDNVGGIGVHIGARVMGEAGPGRVVVTSTVKDLVAGSGLLFEDQGYKDLKGVPGPWRLFEAVS